MKRGGQSGKAPKKRERVRGVRTVTKAKAATRAKPEAAADAGVSDYDTARKDLAGLRGCYRRKPRRARPRRR